MGYLHRMGETVWYVGPLPPILSLLHLRAKGRSAPSTDSDIIYLNVVGSHIVIVNSMEAASDLMEKRSLVYSDRCEASCHSFARCN